MSAVAPGGPPTPDDQLLADLFDDLLQDVLEGRTPDLANVLPDRPELLPRVKEAWTLACSVAGRREPGRPVLGGYEILRELGHGGMGTVYLARHEQLQRLVAIKVLPQSLALSPQAKQRFLEEARALAQIRHQHVVPIHRIIDHEEMLAFEMEYISGGSLQSLILALKQQPKPPPLAALGAALGGTAPVGVRSSVEWFVRVGMLMARALGVVHRHGLVHRDVKPSNILLRADGTPVLADFGLALQGDLGAARTKFAGTPVYAAPERLRGGGGPIDARTDVYSLGITLYEALTSSPPFAGSSTDEVLRRIEGGNTPPLRQRAPHVSADLATILHKAIEPDPRRRYATADELADDLERLLELRPIHARPARPLRRAAKFLSRNRRLVLAATAGAAMVALAAWPLAAHAETRAAARAASVAAHQRGRTALLHPGVLPMSWSPQRDDLRIVERSPATAARLAALEAALGHYRQALATGAADGALRLEHDTIAAVAGLCVGAPPDATLQLPPICRRLVANATSHRRLADGIGDDPLAGSADDDRFACGLFAFLWGDHALSARCWAELGPPWQHDALVDACTALRLAYAGPPERAYPRLFHAARALPGALALSFALADAALAAGDLPLARQWVAALPVAADPLADVPRRLLVADLQAAEGQHAAAGRAYLEIARLDPSNPVPVLRIAVLQLRSGERAAGERLLRRLLGRWPEFGVARQLLARKALLERDTTAYLRHAREALRQASRHPTTGHADALRILRLGGLGGLLSALGEGNRGQGGIDDSVPLDSWLRRHAVRGVEQVLQVLQIYDEASERMARVDPRQAGAVLRSLWLTALQLPQATVRLPAPLALAVLAGIPAGLGWPTDRLTIALLPYARILGSRPQQIQDGPLFQHESDGSVLYAAQMLAVGDLDDDTFAELLIAAPPAARHAGAGCLEVRSAIDGALLSTWTHDDASAMFARAIASLGDVDGDGVDDVLIGLPLATRDPGARAAVELWSGRTGTRLWRSEGDAASFGSALAALGDLDGDGVRDFVVGMSALRLGADAHGLAFVCSGRDGEILRVLPSERGFSWFGASVADAGDVGGDGRSDVVIGGNYGGAAGLVAVFDGATGERLLTLTEGDRTAVFGQTVAGLPDLDGDGRAEILVTAPGDGRTPTPGRVLVFSSRTGRPLYELHGERAGECFGAVALPLASWRRDGRPAVAVGAVGGGPFGNGYVRVFDLQTGRPLQTFAGNLALSRFGFSLVDLGERGGLRELGVASLHHRGGVAVWSMSWADAQPPRPDSAAPAVQRPR